MITASRILSVALLGLAAPLSVGMATDAAAQTSFGKNSTAEPKNAAEWQDAAGDALMKNLRRANSSLAMQGSVHGISGAIAMSVARNGQVLQVGMAQSTGRPSLDAALLRAASRTKQVAPFTPDMTGGDVMTLTVMLGVQRN